MSERPLWGGRFSKVPATTLQNLASSPNSDRVLLPYEIAATRAHARRLKGAGMLDEAELQAIEEALDEASDLEAQGDFPFSEEDVHLSLEKFLSDHAGAAGARIHAGRSRNDLVVADFRMWLKDACIRIAQGITELESALLSKAAEHASDVMPGYTHLQRAQVVTIGHHLLAHGFALSRDFERLQGCYERIDTSVLGAGALAGTSLGLSPADLASDLGFAKTFENSMDAVSARDFALEFLSFSAICSGNLSRLASELVIWTSSEFGFARLDDSMSTGSSMMPQKRNPDVAELVRGKAARIAGSLQVLLGVMKGLPLSYNRDMQEDKEPTFDAAITLEAVLAALSETISTITFNTDALAEAASSGDLFATDLAEWLVRAGTPFREAHETVGKLVAKLEADGKDLSDASLDDLQGVNEAFTTEALTSIDPKVSVRSRNSAGGTAPERVAEQIEVLSQRIASHEGWISARTG